MLKSTEWQNQDSIEELKSKAVSADTTQEQSEVFISIMQKTTSLLFDSNRDTVFFANHMNLVV